MKRQFIFSCAMMLLFSTIMFGKGVTAATEVIPLPPHDADSLTRFLGSVTLDGNEIRPIAEVILIDPNGVAFAASSFFDQPDIMGIETIYVSADKAIYIQNPEEKKVIITPWEEGWIVDDLKDSMADWEVLFVDNFIWTYNIMHYYLPIKTVAEFFNLDIKLDGVSVTASPPTAPAAPSQANPTASKVFINGEETSFDAYNIGGNNFFKLRDLAFALNGTAKQFDVSWDGAANSINLLSNSAYTAVGGEMAEGDGMAKTAVPTSSALLLDGDSVSMDAYNIGGNNYFKLRDIGRAFNFAVDWDGANNAITIDTSKPYTE